MAVSGPISPRQGEISILISNSYLYISSFFFFSFKICNNQHLQNYLFFPLISAEFYAVYMRVGLIFMNLENQMLKITTMRRGPE